MCVVCEYSASALQLTNGISSKYYSSFWSIFSIAHNTIDYEKLSTKYFLFETKLSIKYNLLEIRIKYVVPEQAYIWSKAVTLA